MADSAVAVSSNIHTVTQQHHNIVCFCNWTKSGAIAEVLYWITNKQLETTRTESDQQLCNTGNQSRAVSQKNQKLIRTNNSLLHSVLTLKFHFHWHKSTLYSMSKVEHICVCVYVLIVVQCIYVLCMTHTILAYMLLVPRNSVHHHWDKFMNYELSQWRGCVHKFRFIG